MRPLVPHYDSIYNTYRTLYDRRAFAHDVFDWYVWRGRNLKSLYSHFRNTDHRNWFHRRRRVKSHGICNGRGCVQSVKWIFHCAWYSEHDYRVLSYGKYRHVHLKWISANGRGLSAWFSSNEGDWVMTRGDQRQMGARRFFTVMRLFKPNHIVTWFGRRPD